MAGFALRTTALLALGMIGLTGCASMPGQQEQEKWQVHYARSGGFAGEQKTLTLNSQGGVVIADSRQGKWLMRNLSPAEVRPVAASLRELMSGSTGAGSPAGTCADCLHYKLDIVWKGQRQQASLDDRSLASSGYAPLVNQLNALIARYPPQ
ncbi:hypothetical protein [Thermithiobacillus plumbiphilus]|uniref:Lipoprotein n=1 Tax=Thermithiobacillus plumbiphilus TaxID=1729899 RepID=A0ABU9DB55_9PROT